MYTMAEFTSKSSIDEADGMPITTEQTAKSSGPNSPLSGGSDNGAEKPVRERLKKASIAGLSTHNKEGDDKGQSDGGSAESSAGEEGKGPDNTMVTDTSSSLRGRPTRKRSFDDLQKESMTTVDVPAHDDATRAGAHHKRMRSRDMSSSKPAAVNGKVEREPVEALPEEEDDADAQKSPGGAGIMVEAPSINDDAVTSGNQSPKKKRSRDQFDRDHATGDETVEKEENDAVLSREPPAEPEDEETRSATNGDKGEPDKKRHRSASQEAREAAGIEQVTTTVCS